MEDHRHDVVVIAAGYAPEMQQFLASFPGLASRFSHRFEFEDYGPEELVTVVERHATEGGYELSLHVRARLLAHFAAARAAGRSATAASPGRPSTR